MIYFLRRADGRIKLGTTTHISNRYWSHVKQYGELVMLGVHEGGADKESELLDLFRNDVVEGREWLRPSDRVMAYIAENTRPFTVRRQPGTVPMKTISVYPNTLAIISRVMRDSGDDEMMISDVLTQWAQQLYPEGLAAVERASDDIGAALERDEQK